MAQAFEPTAFENTAFEVGGAAAPAPANPPFVGNRHPGRHPGQFFVVKDRRPYPSGSTITPARGPTIAAVLALEVEQGSQVTYEWRSDVTRSFNGKETRRALATAPRETYDFATYLDDAAIRVLLSNLVVNAAAATAFGVALEHESIPITGASGSVLAVPTTAFADWAVAGQRAIVVAPDGATSTLGVVQNASGTTIGLDVAIGSAGVPGARVMPVMPCYLDDSQSLGLYPANAGSYSLKARAVYFGGTSATWAPAGASVTTYTDPTSGQVYPVYDVPLAVEDSSPRAAIAGATLADFGGALLLTKRMATVDFMRQILHVIRTDADRQFLKAFTGAVLGRTKAFMLPTWKPDLVANTDASSSVLRVLGAAGQTDYAGQWFRSPAQKHLQLLLASGAVAYVQVSAVTDNLDGTQSLQLDRAVAGAISMVSFLETCRLDSDSIVVSYDGNGVGRAPMPVRAIRQ